MRWEITGQLGSHREVSRGIQVKGSGHPGAPGTKGNMESLVKMNPFQTKGSKAALDAERKQLG